jgi:hypothetical protein
MFFALVLSCGGTEVDRQRFSEQLLFLPFHLHPATVHLLPSKQGTFSAGVL